MNNFEPITSKSGNITEAAYDGTDKAQVRFKSGGTYEYSGVSPELYEKFRASFQSDDSTGAFFYQNIKSLPFKRIG